MKLVDEKGNFTFVKNGQVKIDYTLEKYTKLDKIKNKEYVSVSDESSEPFSVSDSSSNYNTNINDSLKVPNPDKTLRSMIKAMDESDFKKYLMSEDAVEFNKNFSAILKGEVDHNSYNVSVYASNIMPNQVYDESVVPIAYTKGQVVKRLWRYIKSVIRNKKKDVIMSHNSLYVLDFFDLIHVESGKEKEFVDKITGYFSLIKNAILMHQDAQLDELCQRIIINIYESVLATNGINKYIEFSSVDKLKCPGKRVVDIDYITNFNRIIPSDVVEKKLKADKMNVFDNYCIMYYDPTGETYAREQIAKRDPILFGLINHSEKLYYIADWVDDYCDLTLDKVAEVCNVKELK